MNNVRVEPKKATTVVERSPLSKIGRQLRELSQGGETFHYVHERMPKVLIWCKKVFGKPSQLHSDLVFRGYIQIQPERIAGAVRILEDVARQRLSQGKSISFKFLLASLDKKTNWLRTWSEQEHFETFFNHQPGDATIAIWADQQADIFEIFESLCKRPDWMVLEQERRSQNLYERRIGTNAYVSSDGRMEMRTLSYNSDRGYSETKAQDPSWRDTAQGFSTQELRLVPQILSPIKFLDS